LTYLAAAIDLGSNSFHVTVVDTSHVPYRVVSRIGEKVQLAAGLNEHNVLSQESIERGLECLVRLAPMLEKVSPKHRFVVATNTLRVAQNRADFITAAKVILGADINVLSGEEEAALIFTGVTSDLAIAPHKPFEKLVIDIGGGSTELVLGKNSPNQLQSFPMGCVAFSHDYFPQRKINNAHLQNAIEAAQAIIESSKSNSLGASEAIWSGWQVCIGSSGTMKALIALSALEEGGMAYLNRASMANIEQQLLAFDYLDDVSIEGVRGDRGEVLPAGYAILMGIMRSLNLDRIYFSTGALREGVLLKALQEK